MCIHCRNCDACMSKAHLFFPPAIWHLTGCLTCRPPIFQSDTNHSNYLKQWKSRKKSRTHSARALEKNYLFIKERDQNIFIEDSLLYGVMPEIHFISKFVDGMVQPLSASASGKIWMHIESTFTCMPRRLARPETSFFCKIFILIPCPDCISLSRLPLNMHNAEKYLCTQGRQWVNLLPFLLPFIRLSCALTQSDIISDKRDFLCRRRKELATGRKEQIFDSQGAPKSYLFKMKY